MNSLEKGNNKYQEEVVLSKNQMVEDEVDEQNHDEDDDEYDTYREEPSSNKVARKSIFDKWAEKFKDFLDNAE